MNSTPRPRLCHIITSLEVGGAQQVLAQLIPQLDNQFEQEVIYFRRGPFVEKLAALGIRVTQVRGLMFTYAPVFWIGLYRHLRRNRPTCIHGLLWSANIAARIVGKLLNIPVVCAIHLPTNHSSGSDSAIRLLADKITRQSACHWIAVSPSVKRAVQHQLAIPAHRLSVIENALDTQAIDQRQHKSPISRASLGLEAHHFVIGNVGRLASIKRHDRLIRLVSQLAPRCPELRLVIVGNGPLENHLRQQANDLAVADRIRIVHACPAYAYYPLFDLFVQPSVAEGLSLALLEAMHAGIPPLVAAPDGKHDAITHGQTGWLYDPATAYGLSRAVMYTIDNREEARQVGHRAKNYVCEHHNLEAMARAYALIFGRARHARSADR